MQRKSDKAKMPQPPRHVFVLCTGRCGSMSFARAAGHATNFTAAHESHATRVGAARLSYPPRHIEVDNRLSWMLGRLDRAYGDAAHYVHLKRDPGLVSQSFVTRADYGIMRAYREGILRRQGNPARQAKPDVLADDMIDTVTQNIKLFLRDKSRVMTVQLETINQDFPTFWDWIGATGDLGAAMTEWDIRHNSTSGQPSDPAQAAPAQQDGPTFGLTAGLPVGLPVGLPAGLSAGLSGRLSGGLARLTRRLLGQDQTK